MHQDAFDLVAEGVLWIDMSGRIQYGNDSAATLLGYSRNELLRASYFEINPHFSMLGWKKFWNRLQENGSERLDTEFVNQQGKLFAIKGRVAFDIYSIDPELCIVVFQSTEAGKRDADLLKALQRDAHMGSWEVNLTSGQVYISPNIRKWFGLLADREFYSSAEFLTTIAPLLPQDTYENLRATYKQLRASARHSEATLDVTLGGGDHEAKAVTYVINAESVENELEVYKVFGTIGPAQQAVGATVGSPLDDNLFRMALDRQLDAVYAVSYRDRKIIYANDRATEMMGYAKKELIGSPASMLTSSDDMSTSERDDIYARVRSQKYVELQTYNKRKDGSKVPIDVNVHYCKVGEEEYLITINHDRSEEAVYSENLQLYTTTLDSLNEWVIWLNSENNIVLLNDAARKKLRRKTSRELDGLNIEELLPDLEIPQLNEIRQEQIDGRHRAAVDYIYTNTSGEDRTLQVRFAQVAAGAQMFLCLICRDVTMQYMNKRRLQKSKRRVDELTRQLQSENETLREQIEQVNMSGPIITVSKKYKEILAQIAQVAGTDATVLITGETGTGKELLAQSIHKFSSRSRKPLVSVNCAALPENLIESELFGHERGAFTGAFAQKKGKFEMAHSGTIFLDEIGELPLDMQAKLLRVLQEGEIQRIGSTESINVDVRVVAATNRNLERMINQGTFREDLFYRLNVFPIHNLPLRERPEDIPVLVKHFAKTYAERMGRNITQIDPRDIEKLVAYDFPGNVRELINLVERAVITSQSSTLNLGASLRALRRPERAEEGLSFRGEKIIPFEAMQKQYIIEALKRTGGKVTGPGGAAELLDLNGRTLMSKMNKLGINRNQFTT